MRGQSGLTLIELMVAIAISAVIIFGAVIFLYHMTTVADENEARAFASLQVQYVGFWLNEDVAQSQEIEFEYEVEEQPEPANGFPLRLYFDRASSTESVTIVYYLKPMQGEDGLSRLYRMTEVYDDGVLDGDRSGTHLVAEYIVTESLYACRRGYSIGEPQMKSIKVNVAADIDGNTAESYYEIFPRSRVDWLPIFLPEDPDDPNYGMYIGPTCTP